eukprot:9327-Heterococcus_DN1.PRE.3
MPESKDALEGMRINDEPAAFNHIIGTLHTEQEDEIGAHSSDIISLSLLGARDFVLTSEDGVEQHRVVLKNLFMLGSATNASLKHAVLTLKDEQISKRNAAVEP